jgi:hypothetical protein
METTISDRFAVVQDDYDLENWQVAAELLTEIVGVRAVSARQQTRDYAEALGNLAPDVLVDTKGDELKLCLRHGGSSDGRPTEFSTKPDSQLILMVLKRAKPE